MQGGREGGRASSCLRFSSARRTSAAAACACKPTCARACTCARDLPRRRPDPRTDILVIARMQGGREGGRASSCLRFSSARRTSAAAACACKPTCARACTCARDLPRRRPDPRTDILVIARMQGGREGGRASSCLRFSSARRTSAAAACACKPTCARACTCARDLPRRRPDPRTDILVIARMQGGREGGRASSCLRFSSARRTSAAAACACKPTCARACTCARDLPRRRPDPRTDILVIARMQGGREGGRASSCLRFSSARRTSAAAACACKPTCARRVHVRSGLAPPAARPTDGHFSYRAHARREGGRPRLVLLALLLGPADFGRRRLRMQADMRARACTCARDLPRRRPDPRTDILVIARMQGGREGGRASSCLRFSSARRTSAAAACACKPTCARARARALGTCPAGGPTHGRTF